METDALRFPALRAFISFLAGGVLVDRVKINNPHSNDVINVEDSVVVRLLFVTNGRGGGRGDAINPD